MASHNLSIGPELIKVLMPHRRPFLMVDRITAFASDPAPTLHAVKYLSANEEFFQGHFPAMALMPGALLFEGMGQAAHLLTVVSALRDALIADGKPEQDLFDGLANAEFGYTLNPAFRPEKAERFTKIVNRLASDSYGMVGAVNLKFIEPVFPGNLVEYAATLNGSLDNLLSFQVEALVNGRTKARGMISSVKGLGVSSMLSMALDGEQGSPG